MGGGANCAMYHFQAFFPRMCIANKETLIWRRLNGISTCFLINVTFLTMGVKVSNYIYGEGGGHNVPLVISKELSICCVFFV